MTKKRNPYEPGNLANLSKNYFKQKFAPWIRRRQREAAERKNLLESRNITQIWDGVFAHEKEEMKEGEIDCFEDPYNPFSSNYNGELVGPDSFGGSDYPVSPFRHEQLVNDRALIDPSPKVFFASKMMVETAQLPCSVYAIGQENPIELTPIEPAIKYSDDHGWIQTYSGRKFFPMNPRVEDIDINDIAHALSNMCRFTGHCQSFYSVAQHCVLVSYLSGTHALWGLLHDASEAYVCDIARPVKRLEAFKPYVEIENNIQKVICKKFGLQLQEPPVVKQADTNLLHTEARDLMSPLHPDWVSAVKPLPFRIDPLPPAEAKTLFLERYRELTEGK